MNDQEAQRLRNAITRDQMLAKKREQNRKNNQAYKERDPERWKRIMAAAMICHDHTHHDEVST